MSTPHHYLYTQTQAAAPFPSPSSLEEYQFQPRRNSTVTRFVEAFLSGRPVEEPGALCGRVLRGRCDDDFHLLSPDPSRRVVMLTGVDGLTEFIGKSTIEILTIVGYSDDDIQQRVYDEGNSFKLFVGPECCNLVRATWENVLEIAIRAYPEAAPRLSPHHEALAMSSLSELEKDAGYSLAEVNSIGVADERFMTPDRFAASQGSLFDARAFLYHSLQLRELFSGDGFTRTPSGERGVTEYIAPNVPISSFEDCCLVPLPL